MAFTMAQYQATLDQLSAKMGSISDHLQTVPAKAQSAADHWWIPDPIAEAIIWFGKQIIEMGTQILNTLKDLVEGAAAPIYMFIHGYEWESIRGQASGVAGEIQPNVLGSTGEWQGPAATAYTKQLAPQATAATSIATIADKTSTSLYLCAGAGLIFYLALAAVAAKFFLVVMASIAALASGVFSWAGFLALLEELGVNTTVILTAVGALSALLTAQATQMGTLHGLAVDKAAFPGGHWPVAVNPAA
ncbi:hypothetical protein [Kitasatospora azatica]|uniref:hypothetical protein n=1 Tax=Kitasatospora azatica TaxID=58347 RepID=UPI0005667AD4|nr:hypothetical protein [Kitasatospora azatica]